jgi:hypothetical protein
MILLVFHYQNGVYMRGIKHLFLLTTDTEGNPSHALGTDKYLRMDMRWTLNTALDFAKEFLKRRNNFQNVYVGFELFTCEEIRDCKEGKGVYWFIDKELIQEQNTMNKISSKSSNPTVETAVETKEEIPISSNEEFINQLKKRKFTVSELMIVNKIVQDLIQNGVIVLEQDLF